MIPYIIETLFLILMVVICLFHAHWFKANLKTGPWFHAIFAAIYIGPMIWAGWFWQHSWVLLVAIATLRFWVYNPLLNLMRGEPVFYLSVNSKNPALWDRLELKYYHAYPYVWGLSLAGWVALQFFL